MAHGIDTSLMPPSAQTPAGERSGFDIKFGFFAALALVTAIPLLALGFGLPATSPSFSNGIGRALWPVIAVTGVGHVAATAFYYADRGFAGLVRANRGRFYLWPLLAVAGACAVFELSPAAWRCLVFGYLAWQLWHFQRQNYGIAMLAARSAKFGPLPREVNLMLDIAVIGGVAGLLSDLSPLLRVISIAFFALATFVLIFTLIRNAALRRQPVILVFLFLGWAFFIPTLLSINPITMVWSYAIGHGAQYLILIGLLSRRAIFGWVGVTLVLAVGLAAWWLPSLVEGSGVWAAVINGLTVGHFLIDAKTWRMREQPQSTLLRDRLDFLFS
jgi:hypothetical protein